MVPMDVPHKQKPESSTCRSHQSDCWHGVQDAKERKRIQDKLAQRARRKRMAERNTAMQKPITKKAQTTSSTTKEDALTDCICLDVSGIDPKNSSSMAVGEPPSPEFMASNIVPRLVCDGHFLTSQTLLVGRALMTNGDFLGITCGMSVPSRSTPAPHVPTCLQPTPLQLVAVHMLWIDRFPFPQFRDNMIKMSLIIDAEDFIRDLFCLKSFSVREGGSPWDPKDWRIGKDMYEKWGYLFY